MLTPTTSSCRTDARVSNYRVHAILGAQALCYSEPTPLEYVNWTEDFERKKAIMAHRMMGFCRGKDWFDNRLNPTEVLHQGSILALEHNA